MRLKHQQNHRARSAQEQEIELDDLGPMDEEVNRVKGGFTPDGRQLVITIKDGPAAG